MEEISVPLSFENINFPRQTGLIKKLRYVSFFINDIVLLVSIFVFIAWVAHLPVIAEYLFENLKIYPMVSILFILCGSSLLFGAKRHHINSHHDTEKDDSPWWQTWIPITLAVITAVIGFMNVFQVTNSEFLSFFHTSPFAGFCFSLIGLALIPPFTQISHRFHFTQFCIFFVSGLTVFSVLETIYQFFAPVHAQHIVFVPLPTALGFVMFCFGILIRWSNRGFFGNFTLDSTVSTFALRLFLINLIGVPLIAFVALSMIPTTSLNMYQILTIIVACSTFISSLLLWINVKLLYKYEFEHLLMKESLRVHNIDLATEQETLQKKLAQLEQDKQEYVEKLNTQDTLRTIVDSVG